MMGTRISALRCAIAGNRSRGQHHILVARIHRTSTSVQQHGERGHLGCYSPLSTTFGSSRDVRQAGSQLAASAPAVIVAITKAIRRCLRTRGSARWSGGSQHLLDVCISGARPAAGDSVRAISSPQECGGSTFGLNPHRNVGQRFAVKQDLLPGSADPMVRRMRPCGWNPSGCFQQWRAVSLASERLHRVDAGGAPGWSPTGQESHTDEQHRDGNQCRRVVRLHFVQEGAQHSREHQHPGQTRR